MKYYLSDIDHVYGVDEDGKIYILTKEGLKPSSRTFIDPMWGGIAEEFIYEYAI